MFQILNQTSQIARLLRSSKNQGRVIGHPAWNVDTFVVCSVASEAAASASLVGTVSHRHDGATVHSLVERIEHHQQDLRQARGAVFPRGRCVHAFYCCAGYVISGNWHSTEHFVPASIHSQCVGKQVDETLCARCEELQDDIQSLLATLKAKKQSSTPSPSSKSSLARKQRCSWVAIVITYKIQL